MRTITSLHLAIASTPASTARQHKNNMETISARDGVFIRRMVLRNPACSFTVLEIKKNK